MSDLFDFRDTTLGVPEILAKEMDRLTLEAQNARDFWKRELGCRKGYLDHAEERLADCEARLAKLRLSGFIIGSCADAAAEKTVDVVTHGVEVARKAITEMSGEGRGSGRTGKQMLAAPHGAIYAWVTDKLDYPKALARALGRTDLLVRGPGFLKQLGGASLIVRDHAWREGFDVV